MDRLADASGWVLFQLAHACARTQLADDPSQRLDLGGFVLSRKLHHVIDGK